MSNWRDQIARDVKQTHAPRVLIYHGPGKKEADDLDQFDVVITTYRSLASEFMPVDSKTGKDQSSLKEGLFAVHWRRIVLDESHTIRSPNTKVARAACALAADSRWSLTGAPIVNNLKDLYSQIKFLGISGRLEDYAVFRSILMRPLNAGNPNANLALQALMGTLCLRPKKDMDFINLKLPPLCSHVLNVKFTQHEREKCEMFWYVVFLIHPFIPWLTWLIRSEAQGVLEDYRSSTLNTNKTKKAISTSYSRVFEFLLRLRQVCNHWKLCQSRVTRLMELLEEHKVVKLTPEDIKALQMDLQLKIESQETCPIVWISYQSPSSRHAGILSITPISKKLSTVSTSVQCIGRKLRTPRHWSPLLQNLEKTPARSTLTPRPPAAKSRL